MCFSFLFQRFALLRKMYSLFLTHQLELLLLFFFQVFQKLLGDEHKREKDAYQFTAIDLSTLKCENLEEKTYNLLKLKV